MTRLSAEAQAAIDGARGPKIEHLGEGKMPQNPLSSGRFKSKVVEIDAYEFQNRVGPDGRPLWLLEAVSSGVVKFYGGMEAPPYLIIRTPEGEMRANPGDWIIRGTEGELYPCKPSVFERKYEPA